MVDSPSPSEGALTATTPRKPITRPAICTRPGTRWETEAAISAANSGTPPLIIPASEESIHCWATEKSTNGPAIQTSPSSATSGRSERRTPRRAAGTSASVIAPNSTRRKATRPGSKCTRPISMNRKDAPHPNATPATSAQSSAPNASELGARVGWVWVVTRTRLGTGLG